MSPRLAPPLLGAGGILFLALCLISPARADPLQEIRTAYARLDAAYSHRDIPSITAVLAPGFVRSKWNSTLTAMQFQTDLQDNFAPMASAAAATRIKSLAIHGDTADAVAIRRLDYTFSKPEPEQPPPYFEIEVTEDHWRKVDGHWQMTRMQDTPLFETLCLLNERDQGIRNQFSADWKNPAIRTQMGQVDAADRARLKQILRQYGWPGYDLVGTEGDLTAWVIVQHSDDDKAFQKRAFLLIQAAVKRGQSRPQDLAYLTDRIRTGEHEPQLYGTQLVRDAHGDYVPLQLVDPAHVDQRRATAGLCSLTIYEQYLTRAYSPKAK